jgi:cell wall-associated NlpC family hydrolase
MVHLRLLLSVLCAVGALGLALLKPLPAGADEPPVAPEPPPASTTPAPQVLAVVKPHPAARRRPQFHLPFRTRVVDFARKLVGTRYVYGGSSPRSGFDCSGLVRYVYGHFGVSLPHSSYAQFSHGRRIGRRSLRPGDLVFFDGLGHVGMYVGSGRFIHAPHTGTRVRVETLAGWYSSRFVGARRLRTT